MTEPAWGAYGRHTCICISGRRQSWLVALSQHVAGRPNIAAYLVSERRLSYNEHGIFRYYPELDG